jgi:hypothetical protein
MYFMFAGVAFFLVSGFLPKSLEVCFRSVLDTPRAMNSMTHSHQYIRYTYHDVSLPAGINGSASGKPFITSMHCKILV